MAERMGGIVRLTNRDEINPDLLKERLREQKEKLSGREKKPDERKVTFSKLQWAVIDVCIKSGWETGNYSAAIENIIDEYYGKRSGLRTGKRVAIHRAVRTLTKKGLVKLMPGLVGRVELAPGAVEIAKAKKPEKVKNKIRG